METINTTISGDFDVSESLRLNGVAAGNVRVAPGGHFECNGIVGGTLVVEAGAEALINGTVTSLINRGGRVEIRGVVRKLVDDVKSPCVIVRGAIVDESRHT